MCDAHEQNREASKGQKMEKKQPAARNLCKERGKRIDSKSLTRKGDKQSIFFTHSVYVFVGKLAFEDLPFIHSFTFGSLVC